MSTTTYGVAPYPLYWPLEQPRTLHRNRGPFAVDFVAARNHLLGELRHLGGTSIVSSNIPLRRDGLPQVPDREPSDPGVAVYFQRRGVPYVVACDSYTTVRANVRAIGLTLEALRAIARHGTGTMLEQAFSGFRALPPGPTTPPAPLWHEVLEVDAKAPMDHVLAAYRALARTAHPDRGGTDAAMARLNGALADAKRERGEP